MKTIGEDYRKPNRGPAVLCDFDDTTVTENAAGVLLEHFAADGWREFQRAHTEKRITLREYQEHAFSTVTAGRETMKALVKEKITLRPYFKKLWHYCQQKHIPLAIVTMGLDFYVEALLEREGMTSIPYYAADTCFSSEGIRYRYRYTWEGCWQPGNCKCLVMDRYRRLGHSILFAGDGRTDICPAAKADQVFARRFLAEHYQENSLPYVELKDFSDVLKVLQNAAPPLAGESSR